MTEVNENEVQTISMNDKEYKMDEISDRAKYLLSQIQDLQAQGNQTRARLDQIEVGIRGFTQMLQDELEKPEEHTEVKLEGAELEAYIAKRFPK